MAPNARAMKPEVGVEDGQRLGSPRRLRRQPLVGSAGLRDPALEKEMATHSSVLAWRIPGMGKPGGLLSVGSHRVGHD